METEYRYKRKLTTESWHCPRFCVNRKLEDSSRSFLFTRGRKINCVMRCSRLNSSVGDRPAPRGGTTRPDERKITTI